MDKSPKDKMIRRSPKNKKVAKKSPNQKILEEVTTKEETKGTVQKTGMAVEGGIKGTYEEVGHFEDKGDAEEGVLVSRETFNPPINTHTNIAESLISQAINKNVDVATMEKLLAMRRELNQEFAREAFNRSMAEFQAECPIIQKTKEVKTNDGERAYKYAPIESIVTQVREFIRKHGFSYRVNTETKDGEVTAVCCVTHQQGHTEVSEMSVPIVPGTKIMSNAQKVAASITFAKRYAFCNAFGIMTGDEDTDAVGTDATEKSETRPKTPEKPNYDKAKEMLAKVKDPLVLYDFMNKVQTSEKYTPEQKTEIIAFAESCIGKLGVEVKPRPSDGHPSIHEQTAPFASGVSGDDAVEGEFYQGGQDTILV
jgi:hypothetical protein